MIVDPELDICHVNFMYINVAHTGFNPSMGNVFKKPKRIIAV